MEKYIETKSYGNNFVDIDDLIATEDNILINSTVQQARYYIPYRSILQQLFKYNHQSINADKLVVHVRETDYMAINSFLGYEFYRKMISDSGFTNIIIVTDNSKCDTVQQLLSEGHTLNSEGYVDTFRHESDNRGMHDFETLMYSENIALSQSTFSWWAGFLGNHKTVIFPFTENVKMWKSVPQKDDIDLYYDIGYSKKYEV